MVEVLAPSPLFDEPTEVVMGSPSWKQLSRQDGKLGAAVARFKLLRDRKVMAPALLAHFLRHRIAPLQKRSHPAWDYQGPADPSRLDGEDMPHKLARDAVAKIFRAKMKTKMPSGVLPLWEDPEKDTILASMPKFSQWGLAGRDDHGPQREKIGRAHV